MELSRQTLTELCQLIHRLCGVVVSEDKAYLIRHRLEPLVYASGCRTFEEFAQVLRGVRGVALHDPIVEAITTGETSFFRDGHPFETVRQHLLPWLGDLARTRTPDPRGAKVRLWCTAASTGQEPYSLAMLLHDYVLANRALGLAERDFTILASDISAKVLAMAEAAEYGERDMTRGLTATQVRRYFQKAGHVWKVRESIRRFVEFRRLNLVQPLAGLGPFDAIFCRNTLIYFDDATRRQICQQLHTLLCEDGWLLLGTAESLYGISDQFESVQIGETLLYRKRSARNDKVTAPSLSDYGPMP